MIHDVIIIIVSSIWFYMAVSGLLADLKGEEKEAIANFNNASVIARSVV